MRAVDLAAEVWRPPPRPPLGVGQVHVWRVSLDAEAHLGVLSPDERQRAARFFRDEHRRRFVRAHCALRVILADYLDLAPESLAFDVGSHGKPSLRQSLTYDGSRLEFNLSHSGDMALVAVARDRAVGVDLERWTEVEHLELADRFFSPAERDALRALGGEPERLDAGFFAAWTRKEAYLKATGHGIAYGLHHFDVTLIPGAEATLLADRLDATATARWSMRSLAPANAYSGALVVASPVEEVLLFDADPLVVFAP